MSSIIKWFYSSTTCISLQEIKKCLSLANCKVEKFSGLKLKYRKKINGIRNDSKNYLLLCTYFTPVRIQDNGVFLNSHSYFYAAGFSQDTLMQFYDSRKPVLWSKWPLASSLLQAIKTCRQACPAGYLMHFS